MNMNGNVADKVKTPTADEVRAASRWSLVQGLGVPCAEPASPTARVAAPRFEVLP